MPDFTQARKVFPLWMLAAVLAVATAAFIWARPLIVGDSGAKAHLIERAAKLRGAPSDKAAAGVGRLAKEFLDASKHVSGVEVRVEAATPDRLTLTLVLPWSMSSAKIHRRRGETAARLVASMLKSAGADGVSVAINVRRKRDRPGASDPVGRAIHHPDAEKPEWLGAAGGP